MDFTFLSFLLGGSVLATLVVGSLKNFLKEKINDRYGSLAVLVVLFLVSLVIAGLGYTWELLPVNITYAIGIIFTSAITVFQVFYKALYQEALLGKVDKSKK
jgi:hypothetical protein